MSDETTFKDASLATVSLRMRDTGRVDGAGNPIKVERVDTAPWPEQPLTPAQPAVAVLTTAVKVLTPPAGSTHCYLSVENAPIRFWNTGDVPSSTNGHMLAVGAGPIEIAHPELVKMIAIGGPAVVQASYHKYDL